MNNIKLNQLELENIVEVLPMFEETFKIKFEGNETEKLNNFNEFSDLIISKINLESNNLCTSQRAFYQFRNVLETEKLIDRILIKPDTELKTIFPIRNRRKILNRIENQIGYKIEVLAPSQITINILIFSFLISFIGLFINWKIAILGIIISAFGLYITKFTNRLDRRTVREIIKKNTALNYFQIRNNENTYNRNEFKDVILEWFSENACIDKEKLRNSTFA